MRQDKTGQQKQDEAKLAPKQAGEERIRRAQEAGLDARTGNPVEKRPAQSDGMEYR